MGDFGDYWREHKEYILGKKHSATKSNYPSTKPTKNIQCECGKWFADKTAHLHHARSKGKTEHKITTKPE